VFWTSSVTADVKVLFSPNGGVKNEVISQLDGAQTRIDVAMYSFSDAGIQDRLIAAAGRGVAIRLILDSARDRAAIADRLEAAGIDVRYIIPVMHHKFAVIDGPRGTDPVSTSARLITGSANWSRSSDTNYDEDFLVYANEPIKVLAYQAEFDFIWDHAREYANPAVQQPTQSVVRPVDSTSIFTSSNFSVQMSRGNWTFRPIVAADAGVAGSAIVAAIAQAATSIEIATTHLRRKDFFEALQAAHQRGVRITIILDQQEHRAGTGGSSQSDLYYEERLAAAGVDVRYKVYMLRWQAPRALQMHSKYLIVDGVKVLTGSFNWSANSETGSIENLNVLEGPAVADYQRNFATILAYDGAAGLTGLMQEVSDQNGAGPCNFEPLTITLQDFVALKNAYKANACR
jgi:phosphatidylserine/phosphatidylglycerophosphate/cardiolipin synthase-like enzyme